MVVAAMDVLHLPFFQLPLEGQPCLQLITTLWFSLQPLLNRLLLSTHQHTLKHSPNNSEK